MKETIKDIIIKNANGLHSNCDISASEIMDLVDRNLPNIYSEPHNSDRIDTYRKISRDFNVDESTVREIFGLGCDWYKSIAKLKK